MNAPVKQSNDPTRPALHRRRLVFGLSLAMTGCAAPYYSGGEAPRSVGPRPTAVLDVEGRVEVMHDGRWYAGRDGMALYAGDEVRTASSSYALIRFVDSNSVWLDYDTRVRVGSIFTFFGRVFASVSGIFQVDSDFVTASTEGTEFTVSVGRGGRNDFSVAVRKGAVRCYPRSGRWRPIRLLSGQRLRGRGDVSPALDRLDSREDQAEFGWVPTLRRTAPEQFRRPSPRPQPAPEQSPPRSEPPSTQPSSPPAQQSQPTPKSQPSETIQQMQRRQQIQIERKPSDQIR